jgi:hypothetical protein
MIYDTLTEALAALKIAPAGYCVMNWAGCTIYGVHPLREVVYANETLKYQPTSVNRNDKAGIVAINSIQL